MISTVLYPDSPVITAGGPVRGPLIVIHASGLPFRPAIVSGGYFPGCSVIVSPGFRVGRILRQSEGLALTSAAVAGGTKLGSTSPRQAVRNAITWCIKFG